MRKYLDAYVTHETKNMTKEEWLRARGAGIGGSDASSVLGFSPYRSSISVYLEKVHYVNLAKGLEDKDIYEDAGLCIAEEYRKSYDRFRIPTRGNLQRINANGRLAQRLSS